MGHVGKKQGHYFNSLKNNVYTLEGIVFVSPAKQKRDICTAFPASSLSSSLSSSSSSAA